MDRAADAGGQALVTDADVGAYLLDSGVAVPESAGCGLFPYFRVSFAASLEKLKEACRRMDAAGRKLVVAFRILLPPSGHLQ